jgi:hypothetical protein
MIYIIGPRANFLALCMKENEPFLGKNLLCYIKAHS